MLLLILSIGPVTHAAEVSVLMSAHSREPAFAPYATSHVERDPFKIGNGCSLHRSGLARTLQVGRLLAVRRQGEDRWSELVVLQVAGDGTVADEVTDRYFALRQSVDILRLSAVAITPSNYKFHYSGEVRTGGAEAYVYDIAPARVAAGQNLD